MIGPGSKIGGGSGTLRAWYCVALSTISGTDLLGVGFRIDISGRGREGCSAVRRMQKRRRLLGRKASPTRYFGVNSNLLSRQGGVKDASLTKIRIFSM